MAGKKRGPKPGFRRPFASRPAARVPKYCTHCGTLCESMTAALAHCRHDGKRGRRLMFAGGARSVPKRARLRPPNAR
jgi:hypothetical protein